tara:strand:+ start:474 stop:959 length:486 start_codon:yes stop_codon:yes gene_type:complete
MYDDHYNLEIYRFSSGANSTLGVSYIIKNGKKSFICFILEDKFNFISKKVKGKTRIPAGIYPLKIRKEGGLHNKYKKRYPEFHKGMIEIVGVPSFTYCSFHCGNDDKDTEGCPLVGDTAEQNVTKRGFIGGSRSAYERFYKEVIPGLGEGSTIKIVDGDDV